MLASRFSIPIWLTLLTLAGVTCASAADYPLPPPPAPEYSGWYLRGDIGFSNQRVKSLGGENYVGYDSVYNVDKGFDSAPFFGLGLGYTVNNWLRFDITGEYRGKANFHGMDIGYVGSTIYPDNYSGSKSEWTFLANAYVDLGTWYNVTPFVGAGIGASYNTISDFTDVSDCVGGCGNPGANTYFDSASKWSFAWALYAGLAYAVTPNVTVEFAYRYLDLGDATTGNGYAFDGSSTWAPFEFNHLTSQDVKLGVRFNLNSIFERAPSYYVPPAPLHSKG